MKSLSLLLFLFTSVFSAILGGLHDLSGGTATTEDELCVYCHVTDTTTTSSTSFPIYGSETNTSNVIVNATLSCLGCHDGITATNQNINLLEDNPLLDRMHPVAIFYNEEKTFLRGKYTRIDNWQNATVINDLLVDGELQCITCHNPHSNDNGRFLRHNNSHSELCFSCHSI